MKWRAGRGTVRLMRMFSVLLLAAFTAACASSSGTTSGTASGTTSDGGTADGGAAAGGTTDIGGSQVVCAGAPAGTPDPQACVDCEVTHCKTQLQATFGNDPSKYGGACQAMYSCICACASSDTTCAFGCLTGATDTCKAATQGLGDCITASCASECPNN